jgi:hypothetical protein
MRVRQGVRKYSAVVTTAVGATAINLFTRTTNALTGSNAARTVIVRKIHAYNAVGATTLTLGTGLAGAFAAILPVFRLVNATDNIWTADEIPCVEIGANLTCQTDIAGVVIVVEVEEKG